MTPSSDWKTAPVSLRIDGLAPLSAASILATSIFFIVIIASNARLAAALSGLLIASSRTRGVICQEKPQLSLHQPQALSSPPLPAMAFQ